MNLVTPAFGQVDQKINQLSECVRIGMIVMGKKD